MNEIIIEIEVKNPEIIFITETWWNETSITNIAGYSLYKKDREHSRGGGVCIYVKDSINSYEINDVVLNNKNIEQIWCSIKIGSENILCGCIYRPGSNDIKNCQNLIESINKSYEYISNNTNKYTDILICGDFNFPCLNSKWDNCYPSVCIGPKEQLFFDCIQECYLTQHVIKPTFQLKENDLTNILDLVLTSNPFRISNMIHTDPLGKSKRGHHVLNFNFNIESQNNFVNEDVNTKSKFLFMKGNYEDFSEYLTKFNLNHEFENLNVNQSYEKFIKIYETGCEKFIP